MNHKWTRMKVNQGYDKSSCHRNCRSQQCENNLSMCLMPPVNHKIININGMRKTKYCAQTTANSISGLGVLLEAFIVR